ncbi:MAG TPA: L,D-transpeptidase family protein [Stellaceae bacterium]|nr:L,D-transpeptidase family protein [Stellaceae bacterium]
MFRITFALPVSVFALLTALPAVQASAEEFPLEKGQVAVGSVDTYEVQGKENMLDLARRFDDGYVDFMAANQGIDPWLPGAGRKITVPNLFILPDAPRTGIVINLAERRIYYFPPGGKTVETYPAGVGVRAGATPLGITHVVRKEDGPVWIPPPSIRAERPDLPLEIPPGPDDPLGAYALRLGWTNYLIHGTNKPDSVGRNVSHGCLHLYPEDIERLFHEVPVGTPVRSISQPIEAGWIDGRLYVEVHPSKDQADQYDFQQPVTQAAPPRLMQVVAKAAGDRADLVDWDKVRAAGMAATGIPTPVTPGPDELQASAAPGRPPSAAPQGAMIPPIPDSDAIETTTLAPPAGTPQQAAIQPVADPPR